MKESGLIIEVIEVGEAATVVFALRKRERMSEAGN
jgi:hypothetical protein